MSIINRSPRQQAAQLNSSPRERPTQLPHPPIQRSGVSSCSHTLLPPTPFSIGAHAPILGLKKSPCPALNALCNHGAYGMPRDGKGVSASVLANALVHVYGLKPYFAYLLAYGAFLGITKGKSFTLDLDDLCAVPIAHPAALAHIDPTQQGSQTDGRPSHYLVNRMLECNGTHDAHNIDIETFAIWRNKREQGCPDMPRVQKYIAAGELALLLQVFGHKHDNYTISRHVVYNFLAHERLPDDWQLSHFKPLQAIGLASTFHVGHHVRQSMAKVIGRSYIPYYVWAAMLVSAVVGVVLILKSHH